MDSQAWEGWEEIGELAGDFGCSLSDDSQVAGVLGEEP